MLRLVGKDGAGCRGEGAQLRLAGGSPGPPDSGRVPVGRLPAPRGPAGGFSQ